MKTYFDNPEIKKSSAVFLLIMTAFIICNYTLVRISNENLKRDYIKVFGIVTARVVQVNPQLEKEILPLLTSEIGREEEIKGKEILEQYGLSETLDLNLFPYIKGSFRSMEQSIFLTGLILTVLLFSFNYLQYGYFYKNLKAFCIAAKRIVEGDYNLKISEEKEGDLSKLSKSFNSMGEVIRNTIAALNKEKRFLVDLLSDISHQLKTPLSTMILYNDIMLTKDLNKDQQYTFLKNNQNQLNRMNWLILNLLKLAKIDADAIELQMEDKSLNETMEETVEILESRAIEGKVKLSFMESRNVVLRHDRLWLQEALINVIKNGIEHAGEGGKVTIELEENPIYTRVIIKDTGEGISEEDLANIFKRFYKGKKTKKSDSIGIGLSLAKAIIEKHGGYIEAHSRINDGTSFIITFLKY